MNYTMAIWLSLKWGILSALLVLPWGMFWGRMLARRNFPGRGLVETLLLLPWVFPPLLTFYGLSLLGPQSPLGRWLEHSLGIIFVLDWKGVVLSAAVVAAPFSVHLCRQAFDNFDRRLELAARTLGANRRRIWWTIILPLSWPNIAAGLLLAFARSFGEVAAIFILSSHIKRTDWETYRAIYQGNDPVLWPLVLAAVALAYIGLAASQWLRRPAGQPN